MTPLSIFAGPYALLAKWGVIAALGLSLMAFGWWKGHEGMADKLDAVEAEYDTFKATVAAEGRAAEKHVAEVTRQQEKANADISTDFRRQLAALRGRVQQPVRADGSQIPVFSCGAAGIDGKPADSVPSVPKADYAALRADASVTTLMVVAWQQWYREQAAAFQ